MKKGQIMTIEQREKISKNNCRFWLGKKMSDEHKRKIGLAGVGNKSWTGKKLSEEHKKRIGLSSLGRPSGMTGKKHTEESKKKMSDYQKTLVGELANRYIHDRSLIKGRHNRTFNDGERQTWHKKVLARDKWKCRIEDKNCNGRLEVHHILPWRDFVELRYEVNNGITLCHAHHPLKRSEEAKLSPFFQSLVAEMQ